MDLDRFDAVARSLVGGPRRRFLGVLASLPVAAGILAILDSDESDAKERRRRRKERHKRHKNPGKRKKGCRSKSKATVCAGQCGPVKNRQTCGKTVDCGSCACNPACDTCFTCQEGPNTPGTCVVDPAQVGQTCGGNGSQFCQADGACTCDASTCSGAAPVCSGGVCVPCSADAPCPDGCCQPDGTCGATCRVFASSSTQTGNLGGLTGADTICQGLAEAAGLPGMYLAWLGDSTVAPNTRFPLAGDLDVGPYVLVGSPEAIIGEDWDGLTARPTCTGGLFQPCIGHPIERDEHGVAVDAPLLAWTATTTSGAPVMNPCLDWSDGSNDFNGLAGETNKFDDRWLFGAGSPCNSPSRLYCFQQG